MSCRAVLSVLGGFLVVAAGSGCRHLLHRPEYVIALYQPVPAGTRGAVAFSSFAGDPVTVARMPVLSSAHFPRVTVVQEGRHLVLDVELNDHAQYVMLQECVSHPGAQLAVVVDGWYHSPMRIPTSRDPVSTLRLPGPWGKTEAELIAQKSSRNYQHFSGID